MSSNVVELKHLGIEIVPEGEVVARGVHGVWRGSCGVVELHHTLDNWAFVLHLWDGVCGPSDFKVHRRGERTDLDDNTLLARLPGTVEL